MRCYRRSRNWWRRSEWLVVRDQCRQISTAAGDLINGNIRCGSLSASCAVGSTPTHAFGGSSRQLLFVKLPIQIVGTLLQFVNSLRQPPLLCVDPGLSMFHMCDQLVWAAIFAVGHRPNKVLVRDQDGFLSFQFDTLDHDSGLVADRQNPISVPFYPPLNLVPVENGSIYKLQSKVGRGVLHFGNQVFGLVGFDGFITPRLDLLAHKALLVCKWRSASTEIFSESGRHAKQDDDARPSKRLHRDSS